MTYGIYIDGNLNTRTGGNSVFFSKFAEGDGLAELEFYTDYECHILITFGFVHHQEDYYPMTVAWLDDVEIMRHTTAGGTVNQQSIKRYIGRGTHRITIASSGEGRVSIFVQGVPAY